MNTRIKQSLISIVLPLVVLAILGLLSLPVFASKNNTPVINWQPSKVEGDVFRGAARQIEIQFISTETLNNIELFIVPEISTYVKILNQSFSSHINANEINSLRLLFSIPNDIPLTFIEGTVHLKQNNKTISKPLPITINILDPTSAVSNLENYLLNQFGITEPSVGSIINPPQEIIDALSIGSNLPLIFKSGSLNFVGYLPPENGALKNSVSNLINLLNEKTLNTPPLINALDNTVYTKDNPLKTVIPYGASAVTFYIGPSLRLLSPLKWMDTNGDNKIDTFVLITDSSIHTVLKTPDIENIKNNLFFENDLILNQSARTIFHELIHATNFNSQCNELSWLISNNEEFYSIYLESFFANVISGNFIGIDFNYNQASSIISSNLTCLEILNIIPPQSVVLNNPTNIAQNSLDLSWSQNYDSDFQFYRIYRSINPNVNFGATLVAEINNQAQTSFTDTDLQAATTYYYKVFVFDKTGLLSKSNEVVAEPSRAPNPPENFNIQYSSSTMELVFNWDASQDYSGATSTLTYKITDISNASSTLSIIETASTTAKISINEFGRSYKFSIIAIDKEGYESEKSETAINIPQGSLIIAQQTNKSISEQGTGNGQFYQLLGSGLTAEPKEVTFHAKFLASGYWKQTYYINATFWQSDKSDYSNLTQVSSNTCNRDYPGATYYDPNNVYGSDCLNLNFEFGIEKDYTIPIQEEFIFDPAKYYKLTLLVYQSDSYFYGSADENSYINGETTRDDGQGAEIPASNIKDLYFILTSRTPLQ